ncbi:MAG: hypothetical protein HY754_14970 [Nitrospirae bacterium]|nr:hypothetical protein [Nitrospirota bacterium]
MSPSIKLNIVIYKEGEDWIAHCLQMDIVASGKSAKAVEDDIIDLIKAQIHFAIDNDNMGNIFKPAPSNIWNMIGHAKRCDSRSIRLLIPHKRKKEFIPPVKEVEFCFA